MKDSHLRPINYPNFGNCGPGPGNPFTPSLLTTIIMSKRLLENNDVPSLAKYIASKRCKKIVLMVCSLLLVLVKMHFQLWVSVRRWWVLCSSAL
ncbi:hypothetical protein BDZ94DRAFT_1254122 [Collybia nuda]|uniref:Uncharacterized protein n=1 Tax=Collybia nuda TaxID=64659 RepID=A0A9P5YBB2_9AGAR|nr:hypothetical protein BDZ94DRAFT_1254122 [Collybia nuda]